MIAEILMQRESNNQAIEFLCDTLTKVKLFEKWLKYKACEGVNLKMPGMSVNGQQATAQPAQETKSKPTNTEL